MWPQTRSQQTFHHCPLSSWDLSLKLFSTHKHALWLRLDWKNRRPKHECIFTRVCFSASTFPVWSPTQCSLGFHRNHLPLSPCSAPSAVWGAQWACLQVNQYFISLQQLTWLTISSLKLQDFPGDWLIPFYPPHLSPPGTLKITYLNQDFTLRALLISLFKLSLE